MHNNNLKALILYKRSPLLAAGTSAAVSNARFRQNHDFHYAALRQVEAVLKNCNISYHKHLRGACLSLQEYDLVITVGGDGTFLDAARRATEKHMILAVNSDPSWSVGQFCQADAGSFEWILKQTLRKPRLRKIFKLQAVFLDKKPHLVIECLNDILVCHANPAAMSRYSLEVDRVSEEQRSSGIWISSAAGSTGAILSADGVKIPLEARDIQYKPRELYHSKGTKYFLKGGLLKRGHPLTIASRMPHGRVFCDGWHIKYPLAFGETIRIQTSPHYVRMVYA